MKERQLHAPVACMLHVVVVRRGLGTPYVRACEYSWEIERGNGRCPFDLLAIDHFDDSLIPFLSVRVASFIHAHSDSISSSSLISNVKLKLQLTLINQFIIHHSS